MNYRQVFAIKKSNQEKILKICPNCPNTSGIYCFLRKENGFKFAYIGQAKHLLSRIADHLQGYQHVDLSIKKHGLWSEENPTGWNVHFLTFPESELDEQEQYYIKKYANAGYQLRNATSGSQGEGKKGLDNARQPKTYTEGVLQGYKNAKREVAHLFELHLDFSPKKHPPTKLQLRAMEKFKNFLDYEGNEE
jgi:hypothetical protein